jgi:molybdopterin-guanine dinucleotide biosynthesis protein A
MAMEPIEMITVGIVLCGGYSKRMGRPKALLPMGNATMLEHVVGRVAEATGKVVVVAAPRQELPKLSAETEVIRDEREGRGPLEGLRVGLKCLEGRAEAAYLSSCDVPFLRPAFIRRLIELMGEHQVCVPRVDGLYHPLAAVYRPDVQAVLEKLLAQNRLRASELIETVRARLVEPGELLDVDPALESLQNINTPVDYAKALARLDRGGRS